MLCRSKMHSSDGGGVAVRRGGAVVSAGAGGARGGKDAGGGLALLEQLAVLLTGAARDPPPVRPKLPEPVDPPAPVASTSKVSSLPHPISAGALHETKRSLALGDAQRAGVGAGGGVCGDVRAACRALWSCGAQLCVEVHLGAQCTRSRDHPTLLLERWTLTLTGNHQQQSDRPAFITPHWLLNAVRSQIHFSQLSAWTAKLNVQAENRTADPHERQRKLSRETCNFKKLEGNCDETTLKDEKPKRKLNVLYLVKTSGDGKISEFTVPPTSHTFPLTDVGREKGVYLKVTLESLPRLDDIPTVKCLCPSVNPPKRRMSKDLTNSLHEELALKMNDLSLGPPESEKQLCKGANFSPDLGVINSNIGSFSGITRKLSLFATPEPYASSSKDVDTKAGCDKRSLQLDRPFFRPNGRSGDVLLDDRMHTPCSESGKHRCSCDDESDLNMSSNSLVRVERKHLDEKRWKDIAKYKRRIRKETKLKKMREATTSESAGTSECNDPDSVSEKSDCNGKTSIPILQASRFDRMRTIGCYRNQAYLTIPASRNDRYKSPRCNQDFVPNDYRKTVTISTQTDDVCECGAKIQVGCPSCNSYKMVRSEANFDLAAVDRSEMLLDAMKRTCQLHSPVKSEASIASSEDSSHCAQNGNTDDANVTNGGKILRKNASAVECGLKNVKDCLHDTDSLKRKNRITIDDTTSSYVHKCDKIDDRSENRKKYRDGSSDDDEEKVMKKHKCDNNYKFSVSSDSNSDSVNVSPSIEARNPGIRKCPDDDDFRSSIIKRPKLKRFFPIFDKIEQIVTDRISLSQNSDLNSQNDKSCNEDYTNHNIAKKDKAKMYTSSPINEFKDINALKDTPDELNKNICDLLLKNDDSVFAYMSKFHTQSRIRRKKFSDFGEGLNNGFYNLLTRQDRIEFPNVGVKRHDDSKSDADDVSTSKISSHQEKGDKIENTNLTNTPTGLDPENVEKPNKVVNTDRDSPVENGKEESHSETDIDATDSKAEDSTSSPGEMERMRWSFDPPGGFHSRTGLPLTSSPAPLRRGKTAFDYDSSINGVSGIKSALFQPVSPGPGWESPVSCGGESPPSSPAPLPHEGASLAPEGAPLTQEGAPLPAKHRRRPRDELKLAPSACLLGSWEESAVQGRLWGGGAGVSGFTVELAASASPGCGPPPPHRRYPATVHYLAPTAYLGRVGLGRGGYCVPGAGRVQLTLLNPHGSLVKVWLVVYDMRDMPPRHTTFLRQRTTRGPHLLYLVHLRFLTSKSGKLYLHTDIRLIVSRRADMDNTAVALRSIPAETTLTSTNVGVSVDNIASFANGRHEVVNGDTDDSSENSDRDLETNRSPPIPGLRNSTLNRRNKVDENDSIILSNNDEIQSTYPDNKSEIGPNRGVCSSKKGVNGYKENSPLRLCDRVDFGMNVSDELKSYTFGPENPKYSPR